MQHTNNIIPTPLFRFLKKEKKNLDLCIRRGKRFTVINRSGGVQVKSSPRMLDSGVRSPIATYLNRKNR